MNSQMTQTTRRSFPVRLFNGDVSLPITYWVFNVLIGGVVLGIAVAVVELNYTRLAMKEYGSWLIQGVYWFAIAYTVFMFIAIWRSAGKYRGWAIWKWFARIAVVLTVLSLIGNYLIGFQQGSNPDLALQEEIRLMNQSLPTMVDTVTRIDHVLLTEGDLYYNYTLVNYSVASAGAAAIKRFKIVMTARLKTNACENKESRQFLNEDRTMAYIYRDKENNPVARVTVTIEDCL